MRRAELMGTLDMLQMAGQEHQIIEATLRLEQRQVKRVGKGEGKGTLQFAVPVLWPHFTSKQILSGAAGVLLAPAPVVEPPALAQITAELYGEAEGPHGEEATEYLPQIEAVILAQKGELEAWYTWAERRFKKGRQAFTVADWQVFLHAVREAADQATSTPAEGATTGQSDLWEGEDATLAREQALEH